MVKNKSVAIAALVMLLGAAGAQAYTGEAMAKHAKVTITQARAIALKARPGKITDEELEKERLENRAGFASPQPRPLGKARWPH